MQNPNPAAAPSAPPPPDVTVAAQAAPQPAPSRVTIRTDQDGQPVAIEVPGRMTVEDVRGLEMRASELNDQLGDAQQRRREVASELAGADVAARPGLEQRLKIIDDRIVQIETQISENGQMLTSLPAGIAMAARRQEQMERAAANNDEDEMFFAGGFVGILLATFVMLVRRWRRRRRAVEHEAVGGIGSERFMRLEQAVDAIAVEVERIAEGQRFTAKLMAETHERGRRDAVARDAGNAF